MNTTANWIADQEEVEEAVAALRTTVAVRERSRQLLSRARRGQSAWFEVDDKAIATAADEIARLTRKRFPGLHIPFHSRWRHFEAGGVDRKARLDHLMAGLPPTLRAHAMVDLTFVSVLL
ncbi:MAG TPA: DUF1688 family protein, partial [Ramlibacter sp.]|nr:DUF1688 family protein [Ramlibacter sp.]